jgi:hypothetical protein
MWQLGFFRGGIWSWTNARYMTLFNVRISFNHVSRYADVNSRLQKTSVQATVN